MGTRLDPVPGLPGGESANYRNLIVKFKTELSPKSICLAHCLFNPFSLSAVALPPPPALDEEAPANYFNLDPGTSPAVMNIALPPPPGINPPPPGKTITTIS